MNMKLDRPIDSYCRAPVLVWLAILQTLMGLTWANDVVIKELRLSQGEKLENAQIFSRPSPEMVIIQYRQGFQSILIEQLPPEARKIWELPSDAELHALVVKAQRDAKEYADEQTGKGLVQYGAEWVTPGEAHSRRITANKQAQNLKYVEYCAPFVDRNSITPSAEMDFKTAYRTLHVCEPETGTLVGFANKEGILTGKFAVILSLDSQGLALNQLLHTPEILWWAGPYTYQSASGELKTVDCYYPGRNYRGKAVDRYVRQYKEQIAARFSYGTGFSISSNGYLMTCAHVIAGAKRITTVQRGLEREAVVVMINTELDLAVLKIDSLTPRFLRLNGEPHLKLGQPIAAIGFPLPTLQGSAVKVTKGVVSSLSGAEDDNRFIQIDAAVQPGNSGGPILSDDYRVIGLLSSGLNAAMVLGHFGVIPQNVNYAIKIHSILGLLENQSFWSDIAPSQARSALSVESGLASVEDFVFQLICESPGGTHP